MTPREALRFVEKHGVVLMSARGPAPSLAQAVAGGPIRGSWWAHPRGKEIFQACSALAASPDVLTCRLVDGKVTFVHRRLWPALVRLAGRLPRERLSAVREEHTPQGKHRTVETPYPRWVPGGVLEAGRRLDEDAAEAAIGADLVHHLTSRAT